MATHRIGWLHRAHDPARRRAKAGQQTPHARRWPRQLGALVALVGAPLGWAAETGIAAADVRLDCFAPDDAIAATSLSWMQWFALTASMGWALLALWGTVLAWRALWRTSGVPWDGPLGTRHVREERAWLIARIAAMASTMCLIGLIATDLSVLVGSTCLAS